MVTWCCPFQRWTYMQALNIHAKAWLLFIAEMSKMDKQYWD